MNITLCDREFLLQEENNKPNKLSKCPELQIKINNTVITNALIDTGANITCMSSKFFIENKHNFGRYEIFPVNNTAITTATGNPSKLIKAIIFLKVQIAEMDYDLQILIVPNLIKEMILGVDTLHLMRAQIDMNNNKIIIYEGKTLSVNGGFCPNISEITNLMNLSGIGDQTNNDFSNQLKCECMRKHFQVIDLNQDESANKFNLNQMETIESINQTRAKMQEMVNKNNFLNFEQKEEFLNLLYKYQVIFSDKPGKCNSHQYDIKIDNKPIFGRQNYLMQNYYTNIVKRTNKKILGRRKKVKKRKVKMKKKMIKVLKTVNILNCM